MGIYIYIGFKKTSTVIQSQKVFGAGGMCDPLGDLSYCRLFRISPLKIGC